jgi:long-chain acyl-CoA synthetase
MMMNPNTAYHKTISSGVRASAVRTPDKVALRGDFPSLTYKAFIERVNRVANLALDELGLHPGDHVALMCGNRPQFLEIVLGIADAGCATAMISPFATSFEAAYIANDSQAKVVFVDPDFEKIVGEAEFEHAPRIIILDRRYEELLAAASAAEPRVQVTSDDIFCIPYTSGTTGKPKGVLLSHRARVDHMTLVMSGVQGCYNTTTRTLAFTPFFNGAGFIAALAPIWFGGDCRIMQKYDPVEFLKIMEEDRITNIFTVPTHFHALFRLDKSMLEKADTSALQVINSNAAALPHGTKERVIAFFGEGILYDSYGSTETGGATTIRPEEHMRKVGSVGQSNPGCEIRIVDADWKPVPNGTVGRVAIRNSWLFSGYWNRPEATEAAVRDGFVAVGDLGYLDEDNFLFIVDRETNTIISGGQNIFPREIEDVLYAHPAIAEAAVAGKPDEYWGEAVIAFAVLRSGFAAPTYEEIKAFCEKRLARYKLPKEIRYVAELPKNGTGKIMHRTLRDQLVAEAKADG